MTISVLLIQLDEGRLPRSRALLLLALLAPGVRFPEDQRTCRACRATLSGPDLGKAG